MAPTRLEPVRVKVPLGAALTVSFVGRQGLPAAAGGHGDLFLTIQIVMPVSSTGEECKLYDQLRAIPHQDPRAELLAQAQRRSHL